jgi:hypothetical protein
MIEQKIIFGCNHIISTLKKQSILFTPTRSSSGLVDLITRDGVVIDVFYVYQLNSGSNATVTYKKNVDYTFADNSITWISTHRPANGESYQCEAWANNRTTIDYTENPELCDRCYGQGWYVDMMPSGYRRLEVATGINKLVQDYIKILYTRRQDDGYGTYLIDMSGTDVYDENQFLTDIAAELTSAALQLEKTQALMLAENATALTAEETLSSVEVTSMEYDKGESVVYVSITLTSLASNSSATMNFKF